MKITDEKRKRFGDLAFELLEAHGSRLVIAVCDEPRDVHRMVGELLKDFGKKGRSLAVLSAKAIQGQPLITLTEVAQSGTVDAICITGFGDMSSTAKEKLFSELNFRRDALISLGIPMLLWLTTSDLGCFVAVAPDFWSRRSVVYYFTETKAADLLGRLFDDDSRTTVKLGPETRISRALKGLASAETELMKCLRRKESFSLPKADESIRRIKVNVEDLRSECKNGRQIEVALWLWNMTHLDYDLERMLDDLEGQQKGLFEYLYTDRNEVVLHICERIPAYLSSYLRQLQDNIRKKRWVGLVNHVRALASRKLRRMASEAVSQVYAEPADFEWLLQGEERQASSEFSSTNAFAHSAAQDLETWLAGASDSMPAIFSEEEGRILRFLYSGLGSPEALAKVLRVSDGQAARQVLRLKEKVRLFLASTG